MSADELFRWIFVAILVGFLPFGLYHRIRSNIGGEKLDRWQEGKFILFGLCLSGLPWFIGGIVWMIDPAMMAWASDTLALWLRWCGFILIAVWGVLFVKLHVEDGAILATAGSEVRQLMIESDQRAFAGPH